MNLLASRILPALVLLAVVNCAGLSQTFPHASPPLVYDQPLITKKYWQDSRPLQTPVKSPSVWCLFSVQGELQALWTGPKPARKMRKDLLLVSGFGSTISPDSVQDLRALPGTHSGRPGLFSVASRDGSVHATFSSNRTCSNGPVYARYLFDRRRDFSYRILIQSELSTKAISVDKRHGCVTVAADSFNTFHFSMTPMPAISVKENKEIVFDVRNVDSLLLTFDGAPSLPQMDKAEPLAASWLRVTGTTVSNPQEVDSHRVEVETGITDLDAMIDASIDAIDNDRFPAGVVIAGPDNDFYRGSWLRDGTYSIIGYELATSPEAAEDFYRFWVEEGGFSEFGEAEAQQPAIAILGLWWHARRIPDGQEFIARMYPYISRWSEYYLRRLEKEVLLNVYEEWIACKLSWSTWPNAEIFAGLESAARMAKATGHAADAARWSSAAQRLRENLSTLCYDTDRQRFVPIAGLPGTYRQTGPQQFCELRDERVDAGMYNVARLQAFGANLGVVRVDDPRFASTQAWITRVLFHPDYTISRFDAGKSDFPLGNWPVWPIISSWAAQVEYLKGRTDIAWKYLIDGQVRMHGYDARELLYQLPEQWNLDGTSAGTTRLLTWSHGEFLTSSITLLTGLDTDVDSADAALWPSLPPESDHASVRNLYFQGYRLNLSSARSAQGLSVTLQARRTEPRAPDSLLIKIGNGRFIVRDNNVVRTVLPPEGRPSFTGHPLERARQIDEILLETPLPDTLSTAPPAVLENHIRESETRFINERLRPDREQHFRELLLSAEPDKKK